VDPSAAFLSMRPDVLFLINGRSWPHTERLRYDVGQVARWRVVNLSTQVHPMHLHGFYFSVDSLGDGTRDRAFADERKPRVVTQLMQPGATMTMAWTPERAGNWLFHCHVMTHVSPMLHVDGSVKAHREHPDDHHAGAGMKGMVLGITVSDPHAAHSLPPPRAAEPRRLALLMRTDPDRFGAEPAFGFVLDGAATTSDSTPVPGPTLVLARGEPVEITLVNQLTEATAIHWHGMELESYYDGAHGWGGNGEQVTPMVAPGSSFVVRFTPPRTGTFMYHTHLHDRRQLTSGLYGAMLVVDRPAEFDEATDHVVVLGRGGPQREAPVVVNGAVSPQFVWKSGTRHRIRLINITPDDILTVSLQSGDAPIVWRPLTKDGAPLPPGHEVPVPSRQIVGVGETYDFEFEAPPGRRTVWLEVRSPGGRWLSQARIIIG
jgi:FtsP/CotA-like multicopper oxidase with cupredoxin domain